MQDLQTHDVCFSPAFAVSEALKNNFESIDLEMAKKQVLPYFEVCINFFFAATKLNEQQGILQIKRQNIFVESHLILFD